MHAKRRKGEGKGNESWEKAEDALQGVILADSFNFKFLPITLERPRTLLPLANCPLLEYTIEFLAEAGVEEVFVFCTAHADQIKNYLNQSKWLSPRSPCDVHIIILEDCLSLGDALREIDRQSLIRSDFVLVSGDVVSNLKLDQVLQEHKTRRQKDKSSVMTMVLKIANPGHRTRCQEEDIVVALDSSTNRLLHCERSSKNKKFSFPLSLFQSKSNSIQLRHDLLDCNICICSTQVPQQFTDNFDYQTRDDFVRGILVNEEIMGNQIHCHLISDRYAARVSNLYMYDAVSKDILSRWAYPIVPDNSVFFVEDSYAFNRHNVYLDKEISLARGCVLKENLVIGRGTTVADGAVITNSVIGKNCVIGDDVRIEGAHLWDNVTVESGCYISKSILCTNVRIKRNVRISSGSLISFNVVVGPDFVLPSGTKLTLKQQVEDDSDFGMDDLSLEHKEKLAQPTGYNPEEVGLEGQGYVWKPDGDSDQETNVVLDPWGVERFSSSDDESSSESSEEGSLPASPPPEDTRLFYNEVLETIRCGVTEGVSPENIVLEINASKYAYNVTFRELNQAVIRAVLESALPDNSLPKQDMSRNVKKTLEHLKPTIVKYVKDVEGQKDVLQAAEEYFAQNMWASSLFQVFLHILYDSDILDESVILHWHSHPNNSEDVSLEMQRNQLREQVSRFIQWLQEAEEESEENEESD